MMAKVVDIRIEDHTDEVKAKVSENLNLWLEAVGQDAASTTVNIIDRIHLVDTGRLKNSISHAVDTSDKAVYIGTNVHNEKGHNYAIDHEFGTSRGISAKHFLQAGASMHKNEYKELLNRMLDSE